MQVWFVRQIYSSFDYGTSYEHMLFSTQEKAEEKFMELVDSNTDLFSSKIKWELDNSPSKMFSARDENNSERSSNNFLTVGNYVLNSGIRL